MAWTAPRTWVTSEIVTASHMNTHVRDNLLETAPAKATTASGIFVTTGANSLVERIPVQDLEAASVGTTSTTYTTVAPTPGFAVTTGTRAILGWSAGISNNTAGALTYFAIEITGATTSSATDSIALVHESSAANDFHQCANIQLYEGLTAGSNSFGGRFRVTAGTGTFINRRMMCIPL